MLGPIYPHRIGNISLILALVPVLQWEMKKDVGSVNEVTMMVHHGRSEL